MRAENVQSGRDRRVRENTWRESGPVLKKRSSQYQGRQLYFVSGSRELSSASEIPECRGPRSSSSPRPAPPRPSSSVVWFLCHARARLSACACSRSPLRRLSPARGDCPPGGQATTRARRKPYSPSARKRPCPCLARQTSIYITVAWGPGVMAAAAALLLLLRASADATPLPLVARGQMGAPATGLRAPGALRAMAPCNCVTCGGLN